MDNETSSSRPINAGIPQGGCLSAILFAIFINGIAKKLNKIKNINFALFADDVSIWTNSKNCLKIQKALQKATDAIQKYSVKWGMKLNTNKTKYILFHKKYHTNFSIAFNKLNIKLYNKPIEKSEHPVLLGINLDKHLNFIHHFQLLLKELSSKRNLIYRLCSNILLSGV